MPRSRTSRDASKRPIRWHKQFLLPLPDEYVRDLSLANHLALVGCGPNAGGRHALNDLIRVTYLSFFMWEAGYGDGSAELYLSAERVLDQAVIRAEQTGVWRLEADDVPIVQKVLCVHDRQISDTSTRSFLEAKARLKSLLRVEQTVSPIAKWLMKSGDDWSAQSVID